MPSLGNRQVIIAILLAATMVLAGCSGGGGPTPTDATDDGSTDAGTDGDTDADAEAEVEGEVSASYDWTEGESYTYESGSSQGSPSQYTWDVTDVSGEEVTAEITSTFSGRSQTSTITGPQGDIFGGSGDNPPQSLTFVLLQVPQLLVQGHSLQPGNSWTVSSSDLQMSGMEQQEQNQQIDVSVTGTSQIAGTQCYTMEASTPNQTFSGCVKEDWPFAVSMSLELQTTTTSGDETQTSSQTATYTLVEYNKP